MKKIISVILACLFVLSLTSCVSDGKKGQENTTEAGSAVITLSADKDTVSMGDTVTVTVNVKNAPCVACYDIYVYSDEKLSFVSCELCPTTEMMHEAKYDEEDGLPCVKIKGIIATACNIDDCDIYTIEYVVSEDAVSGDVLDFTVDCYSFLQATDLSGDKTNDICDDVVLVNTSVKVV